MSKEKVIKFLEDSYGSTWADEMQFIFHNDHKIINTDKWHKELFNCVKLAGMIKTGKLDPDVKNFLIDSCIGSSWSELMTDAYNETFYDYDDGDYNILTCKTLLSFFE